MSRKCIGSILLTTLILLGCEKGDDFMPFEVLSEYSNNFSLTDEWEDDYGIGDPYIIRYNGKYFLYSSTHDGKIGVKCWSSVDLVEWEYEGLVTHEEITQGAYAPEVIYWNGTFYMYTSPGGNGHYVLESESPTGPFIVISDNIGLSIDGSVFIDNNAEWYFYYSSPEGIQYARMIDPITIENGSVLPSTFMNGWTEGPTVIERGGRYYITYTGNHVKSKGYRVNYSTSITSPYAGYSQIENNPILISTEDEFNGLGHSSSFLGPDLDSYYMTYHNLIGEQGFPLRKLNIDRLVFNGSKMSLLGPTNYDMPVPSMPDFYGWVDKSSHSMFEEKEYNNTYYMISSESSNQSYTAEFSFSEIEESDFGIIFGFEDELNYGVLDVDVPTNTLILKQVSAGIETEIISKELPYSFDFSKLHTIRIQNGNDNINIYFDNMRVIEASKSFASGKIGYVYSGETPKGSFMAFTNRVFGESDFETVKPIPGKIEGIHYIKDEKLNKFANPINKSCNLRIGESSNVVEVENKYLVRLKEKNDQVTYKINVKNEGKYSVDALAQNINEKVELEVSINGKKRTQFIIDPNELSIDEITKVELGQIKLEKGYHYLTLKLIDGNFDFETLDIFPITEKLDIKDDLESLPDSDDWRFVGEWLNGDESITTFGFGDARAYFGNSTWHNYGLEVELAITEKLNDTGIYYNLTSESEYQHQVEDSAIGYYLSVKQEGLELYKINYGREKIGSYDGKIELDEFQKYKIVLEDNVLKVYLNNENEPVISVLDNLPYTHGKVGFNAKDSKIRVRNISITQQN